MENENGFVNEYPPPPPGKSSAWKWVLGGCLGATVLAVLGIIAVMGWIKDAFTLNPARVESLAQEMLEFEHSLDVKGAFGVTMLGFKMAMLMPEGGRFAGDSMALTLMTFPNAAQQDPEEMQRQMREQLEKQGHGGKVERELEPEVFLVRGVEVTAAVQIQKQATGQRLKQYFFFLDGKEGPVMLMLMGDPDGITHEGIQGFLDGVK